MQPILLSCIHITYGYNSNTDNFTLVELILHFKCAQLIGVNELNIIINLISRECVVSSQKVSKYHGALGFLTLNKSAVVQLNHVFTLAGQDVRLMFSYPVSSLE